MNDRIADDPLPRLTLRSRVKAAYWCLRGRSVLYRVLFGEYDCDPRVSVTDGFLVSSCRFQHHQDPPSPEWDGIETVIPHDELPPDQMRRSISFYLRNLGSEPWDGRWNGRNGGFDE